MLLQSCLRLPVSLYTICIISFNYPNGAQSVLPLTCVTHSQPGDIVLGGIFPLRFDSQPIPCQAGLSPWAVRLSEAMIFAVNEINRRHDILPNVTLGFDLRDDCRSEEVAIWTAMSLARNLSRAFPDYDHCNSATIGQVVGIVGTAFSETSIFVTKAASLFSIPLVSYAASSEELSDKTSYPFFLRTYPPDSLQVQAIVDLMDHFKWKYVGLIYSINSDGIRGAFSIQEQAEQRGICVAFATPVREFATSTDIQVIVEKLEEYSDVKVIVLFSPTNEAQSALRAAKQSTRTNITWIGTTHWGYLLAKGGLESIASSALLIRDNRPKVEAFGEYFNTLRTTSPNVSPWFKELALKWMASRNCSDLALCPLYRGDTEGLVINAVYSYAHALHSLICADGKLCVKDNFDIDGDLLLETLKNVDFYGPYGRILFDANGNARGKYDIVNLQRRSDAKYEMVEVGMWDSASKTHRLVLNEDRVQWPGGRSTPPTSVCKEICQPGYVVTTLNKRCCLGCSQCPQNAITMNETTCLRCEKTFWPDEDFRKCLPIIPSHISISKPIVIALLTAVFLGVLLCFITGAGLLIKRHHPLIKATSRELITTHFMGLVLSLVCVMIQLLAKPTGVSCVTAEALLSISFTMMYATALLKVVRIYRIFKLKHVTTRPPRFTSPKSQIVVLWCIVFVQVCATTCSTIFAPSYPVNIHPVEVANYSEIYCSFGYGFIFSCSINLAIIVTCCYFAFRTRMVPTNYNESKYIGFSVCSTFVLYLAVVPVYATAVNAMPRIATISLATLLNMYLSLVCLYFSKICAVYFGNRHFQGNQQANNNSLPINTDLSTVRIPAIPTDIKDLSSIMPGPSRIQVRQAVNTGTTAWK